LWPVALIDFWLCPRFGAAFVSQPALVPFKSSERAHIQLQRSLGFECRLSRSLQRFNEQLLARNNPSRLGSKPAAKTSLGFFRGMRSVAARG
jgi:hypothetical protein